MENEAKFLVLFYQNTCKQMVHKWYVPLNHYLCNNPMALPYFFSDLHIMKDHEDMNWQWLVAENIPSCVVQVNQQGKFCLWVCKGCQISIMQIIMFSCDNFFLLHIDEDIKQTLINKEKWIKVMYHSTLLLLCGLFIVSL